MVDVALFHMYPNFGGGTTEYTAQLALSLQRCGYTPEIYRVRRRTEGRDRRYAHYEGLTYSNVSLEDALRTVKSSPSLLTVPSNAKHLTFDPQVIGKLLRAGMRAVVHDPTEFEIYDALDGLDHAKLRRPICIRPSMLKHLPGAVFIPHPYNRASAVSHIKRNRFAVCVSRVTFKKRIHVMYAANRHLPKSRQIVAVGALNRFYGHHKLFKEFPEHANDTYGFPRFWGAGAHECARAKFAVDLSSFDGDGGGTQYTFLEAWDAGTINVLNNAWLSYDGEMKKGRNCAGVDPTPAALVEFFKRADFDQMQDVVEAGYVALSRHAPKPVVAALMQELRR